MSRIRRTLDAQVRDLRAGIATLSAALQVEGDPSLVRLRDALMAAETEAHAALRDYDERHQDPDKTPVRPPSQQMRAVARETAEAFSAERVAQILEQGKRS